MHLKKILLVDNDKLISEAIGDLLTEKGYQVTRAYDGLEALERLRGEVPDILILDIVLPKLDGSRLCLYLRQDPKLREVPIIAFSGLAPQDIVQLPGLSADAYVAKGPLVIVAKNLLEAVKRMEEKGRSAGMEGATFGYEGFRPRELVSEMLKEKRHSELLLRTLGVGIIEIDLQLRITFVNGAAAKVLGKREWTLVGSELLASFHPREREAVKEILRDLAASDEPRSLERPLELRGRRVQVVFHNIIESGRCSSFMLMLSRESADVAQPK